MENVKLAPQLLTRTQLAQIYGISFSNVHLLSLEAAGLFPKRIRLSVQRTCWSHSEIESWINSRMTARQGVAQ